MRLKDFKDINHALSNIWLNAPATWKTDETLDAHRKQVHRWRAARKRRTGKRYGVSWDRTRNKWTVRIQHKGKQTKLGRFRDEISAAHAWDAFVVRHGLMRPLNFSLDDIELEFVMFDGFTNFAEAIWRRAPVTWKTLDALTSHAHQMRHWRRKLKNTAYDALRATFGSHRIACDGGHPSVARVFNAMIDRGTLHMCMPETHRGEPACVRERRAETRERSVVQPRLRDPRQSQYAHTGTPHVPTEPDDTRADALHEGSEQPHARRTHKRRGNPSDHRTPVGARR